MDRSVHPPETTIPLIMAITTYLGYMLLIFFGHIRDFVGRRCKRPKYPVKEGYAPIVSDFEDFYTRRLYHRIEDCWNRPIASCPGATIDIVDRHFQYNTLKPTFSGTIRECVNLGSYNYLGFGDPTSPTKPAVFAALSNYACQTCSPRTALGTTQLHVELERSIAKFIRKPAALVFGMGFATNSTVIPAFVGQGSLVISDRMNHSSIAVGCRCSGASVKVFQHNDVHSLERIIRSAIVDGQPRTHRPWKKILIVVEGIYSMEGETCPLAEIVALKKKYNCYLYVDEAHSVGAIGATGRGVCEHTGVDPTDVDILMGTFTKSFGAVGGYIAADTRIIQHLRFACAGSVYSSSISPPAAQQVISALRIITGEDGTDLGRRKITALHSNANLFREGMLKMGCHVMGNWDSPVVPVMLYSPAKLAAFSRECYKRGLAVVVVGFPATPLLLGRARFCISAAHTREQIEDAVKKIDEVSEMLGCKFNRPLWKTFWPFSGSC